MSNESRWARAVLSVWLTTQMPTESTSWFQGPALLWGWSQTFWGWCQTGGWCPTYMVHDPPARHRSTFSQISIPLKFPTERHRKDRFPLTENMIKISEIEIYGSEICASVFKQNCEVKIETASVMIFDFLSASVFSRRSNSSYRLKHRVSLGDIWLYGFEDDQQDMAATTGDIDLGVTVVLAWALTVCLVCFRWVDITMWWLTHTQHNSDWCAAELRRDVGALREFYGETG